MSVLRIVGGRPLRGRIDVDGNKNAALPLIAACLLTDQPCTLHNVPRIRDVQAMLELLRGLGAEVSGGGTTDVTICCAKLSGDQPDPQLVGRLRGSVLLLGPLLARQGRVQLAPPGGDFPTRRTIDTHVQALSALGARELPAEAGHVFEAPEGRLVGASFYLDEASVTATEAALLAAAAAEGVTEIRHAACEPHVVELCRFMQAMGIDLEGEGTPRIRVHGTRRVRGATHTLRGDYIEAGSWAVLGAVTSGEVEIVGAHPDDLEPITSVMQRMRVDCRLDDQVLHVGQSSCIAIRRLVTGLWPGFPSDMVSLITVLATQAEGRTLIHDWMYELRLFALEQLSGMRADLFLCDPHRIVVTGRTPLRGRDLDSRDLRSGMALIAAALAADGESSLAPLETVERGYARLVERLTSLGAQVEREPVVSSR
ncbi:MAG: UDP-N-acetylglucosamine 1-carboxyvinyltransferase [Luteitalea sp.]|nr:UDP-N-acetylglucosamine 1-carboxyvinyltransferase [Luteitalea sp.]